MYFSYVWAFVEIVFGISVVNIWERIAKKLCIIILLRFGLVTFRFHYRRTRKPLTFMIWGFSIRFPIFSFLHIRIRFLVSFFHVSHRVPQEAPWGPGFSTTRVLHTIFRSDVPEDTLSGKPAKGH